MLEQWFNANVRSSEMVESDSQAVSALYINPYYPLMYSTTIGELKLLVWALEIRVGIGICCNVVGAGLDRKTLILDTEINTEQLAYRLKYSATDIYVLYFPVTFELRLYAWFYELFSFASFLPLMRSYDH